MLKKIEERERQIKDAMANEESFKEDTKSKIDGIDSDIEIKEEEIEQLKKEKEAITKEAETNISNIWNALGLHRDRFKIATSTYTNEIIHPISSEYTPKKRKIPLQELVDANLVRDGQTLYFFHSRTFKEEQTEIVANQNKLKYTGDGKFYSVSEIAKIIDIKLGLKHDEHGVAGPSYWKTEDGQLLHNLNEIVRRQQK